MQRSRKYLGVTRFGEGANWAWNKPSNRFARGTMPMEAAVNVSLGDPVVWFREDRNKNFSDRVSEAYRLEDSKIEETQPSIAENISEVLFESTYMVKEDAPQTGEGTISLQNSELAAPDIVFAQGTGPIFQSEDRIAGGTSANARKRITGIDLWSVVLGTLVLSIGAQFVLQGFGLANP